MTEASASDSRFFRIAAVDDRGDTFATAALRAVGESEARKKAEAYTPYQVRLRHENGGTEWQTVLADSRLKARETAFERALAYQSVLDVEEIPLAHDIEVSPQEWDDD